MTDMADFLTACLDEDQRVALDAPGGAPWEPQTEAWPEAPEARVWGESAVGRRIEIAETIGVHAAAHIARHDPDRVLREIATKRRVLARHAPHGSGHCWNCVLDVSVEYGSPVVTYAPYPCPDLLDLALPYADRPGYKPAWSPT